MGADPEGFNAFAVTDSVMRRYAPDVFGSFSDIISSVSSREGAAIIRGPEHEGVALLFLDLSTRSSTGTFKDWVACLTIASCVRSGCRRFISQSSGNTANALAYYAARAGVQVSILYPAESRYKINSDLARQDGLTFVEVVGGEPMVKLCAEALEDATGLPWLPTLELQRAGNGLRADFVRDYLVKRGGSIDWHAQALSSAFGPLGFYGRMEDLVRSGDWPGRVPRFLGIQQEAVSPFFERIYGRVSTSYDLRDVIEPTLFRSNPSDVLVNGVRGICESSQGRISVLRNGEYYERREEAIHLLESAGLVATRRMRPNGTIGILEEAGLIAVVGVLHEIEQGTILPEETVLVALTGGFFPRSDDLFEPELQIGRGEWRRSLDELGRQLSSQAASPH